MVPVGDGAGVVPDAELLVPVAAVLPLDEFRVRAELGVQVGEVGGVAAAGHVALLREQLEDDNNNKLIIEKQHSTNS